MKRTELIKRITKSGCVFIRHGANHDLYKNTNTGNKQPIPRHNEINEHLAKYINIISPRYCRRAPKRDCGRYARERKYMNVIPETSSYLSELTDILRTHWPENRTVNIVCHGHSVPAGYFATPMVDTMNAYPHLLHVELKHRFPFAVINIIVSATGGENSESGAHRFERDVLCYRPDIIAIDYGLNDRSIGLERAHAAWSRMIEAGLTSGAKMLLLTPTPDSTQASTYGGEDKHLLGDHAEQIRTLAAEYTIGLADSLHACMQYSSQEDLSDILSWNNHPNRSGHELVARELLRWFPAG